MDRRQALTAIAASLCAAATTCVVCRGVGFTTIRTDQHSTVTVRCSMECKAAR